MVNIHILCIKLHVVCMLTVWCRAHVGFGQHIATWTGVESSSGNNVIHIMCDVAHWKEGFEFNVFPVKPFSKLQNYTLTIH